MPRNSPADEESGPEREQSATSRRVQEAITGMHEFRAVFLRARQAGTVSQRLTLQFQARVVELAETLRPFKDRAPNEWKSAGPDEYDSLLDNLPEYTAATEVEDVVEVGFGRLKRERREVPRTLPAKTLIEVSHDLDAIANEIGFVPAPDTTGDPVHGGTL